MKLKSFVIGTALVALAAAVPFSAMASFGPANRATFQCTTPTNCEGADYVAFNSFTNAPNYGDERSFFDGKDLKDTSGAFTDVMNVKDGQEVHLRIYVHNNADPKKTAAGQAIAKNTTVKVQLPQSKKTDMFAVANIFADNAKPGLVNDTLSFKGDKPFTLEYVNGSAKSERRLDGKNWSIQSVPDSIVTTGANLGDWKGCFEYSGFVTLTVKVKMDKQPPVEEEKPEVACDAIRVEKISRTQYRFNVEVSANGTTNAPAEAKEVTIDFGDGESATRDINSLPVEHTYAKAGDYQISATATFEVDGETVTGVTGEACKTSISIDENPVTPPATEEPGKPGVPETLPSTGPAALLSGIFGASAMGYGAHQWVLSRRALRNALNR